MVICLYRIGIIIPPFNIITTSILANIFIVKPKFAHGCFIVLWIISFPHTIIFVSFAGIFQLKFRLNGTLLCINLLYPRYQIGIIANLGASSNIMEIIITITHSFLFHTIVGIIGIIPNKHHILRTCRYGSNIYQIPPV